jgi:pimeloyl-ACP methyl ester carboxylesterase
MYPYFFGSADKQLFAVRHRAHAGTVREHGVIVCYPWGHEYVNALRGCRQLSARLAQAGFDVLRVDYSGSGDSAGMGEESEFESWVGDVGAAIDELKAQAGVPTVSLVGIRLGGTLAVLAAARRTDVVGLALWEPVVHGPAYLGELRARHASFLRSEAAEGRSQENYSTADEIMGFPLPTQVASAIERIDLTEMDRAPVRRVLLLEDEERGSQGALAARLRELCDSVEHRRFPGQKIWVRDPGQERALVPVPILTAIVNWFAEGWS